MWRILDISGDGYHIYVEHSNVRIAKGDSVTAVAFADIHSIICHGYRNEYSETFLSKCIENEVPVIFCDSKHHPSGMLLPWYQHGESFLRQKIQIDMTVPRGKRAWKYIIQAKIRAQAALLNMYSIPQSNILKQLADKVTSGDSSNMEAQAARIYFTSLFGKTFLRSDDTNPINSFLNYGYIVLRFLVARMVVSCGLNPSIGVFHSGLRNPFCLIDDLMEPLRPFVDYKVIENLTVINSLILTPQIKKELISIILMPVEFNSQKMELMNAVKLYILDYLKFISGKRKEITIPVFDEEINGSRSI